MLKSCATAFLFSLAAVTAQADCRFTLQFAYGSASLSTDDAYLLRDLAVLYPTRSVSLTAHADDDGTGQQNTRLAQARADAVLSRMRRAGLSASAIDQVVVTAEKWDVVPTSASSVLNRRVELFIKGCDPTRHPEARRYNAPGVRFRENGRVRLTSPQPPRK